MSAKGRHTKAKEKKQRKKLHAAAKASKSLSGPKFLKAAKKSGWI